MKPVFHLVKFNLRFTITLLLCFFALYVAGGRYLIYSLPAYQADLEAVLSASLKRPVDLDRLEGDWSGFDVELRLRGLEVGAEKGFSLDRVSLRFGFLASILALEPRFKSLELADLNVLARQSETGWNLGGYEVALTQGSDTKVDLAPLLKWFEGADITFLNTQISVDALNRDSRTWRLPGVSLNYQDNELYASGQTVLGDALQPVLNFSIHGEGVASSGPVISELYLEARSLSFLDDILGNYAWRGMALESLDANGRFWADFEGLSVRQVQGDVQVSKLDWRHEDQAQVPITNLATRFEWQNQPERVSLALSDLAWQWRGQRCGSYNAVYDLSRPDLQSRVYIDQVALNCVSPLLVQSGLVQAPLKDRLIASQPDGAMRNILFRWGSDSASGAVTETTSEAVSEPSASALVSSTGRQALWSLEAELADVGLQPFKATPGGDAINGYLFADANGGKVMLDTDLFSLYLPKLFPAAWQFESAQAVVNWQLKGENVDVYSDGVRLALLRGGSAYGDFLLRLNPGDDEDYFGLAIALQDTDVEFAKTVIPDKDIDADLYAWLQRALISGQVPSALYMAYGSVEDDSADNSFTSSLKVTTDDMVVKFDPEWPPLEELQANISLHEDALSIHAEKASIHDSPLFELQADMPTTQFGAERILRAKARTLTQGDNLNYWLNESAVSEHTGVIGRSFDIDGALEVDIDLQIPMTDEALGYRVETTFKNNDLLNHQSKLRFTDVSGVVRVDSEQGILADGLSMEFMNFPASVSLQSSDTTTRVSMRGQSAVVDLTDYLELGTIAGLSGRINFEADLDLPLSETEEPVLHLRSDLSGMVRDMPYPLSKQEQQKEDLSLSMVLGSERHVMEMSLSLADELRLKGFLEIPAGSSDTVKDLDPEPDADKQGASLKTRGVLALTEPDASESSFKGLREASSVRDALTINAAINHLDIDDWHRYIERFSAAREEDSGSPVLQRIDLATDQLDLLDIDFGKMQLAMRYEPAGWSVDLDGERLRGKVHLPTEARILSLDLDHLVLSTNEEDSDNLEQSGGTEPDPKDIPELKFAARNIIIDTINYGAWSTHLKPENDGVRFSELQGQFSGLNAEGSLNWQLSNGHPNTFLDLKLRGENVEPVFLRLGKTPPMNSKLYQAEASLVWQDHPHKFAADKLSGTLVAEIEEGFLKTPDEKTGALRLLGIFNADALGRRLKLDFSDLYKSGIGYDEFKLNAQIDRGNMQFKEPVTITGPSSSYKIKGATNLADQTLDLEMNVELPVSSNVPLAAIVLGAAPQVGGAVWLIDKLLGSPLSSITSVDYRVHGTWDSPKLEVK